MEKIGFTLTKKSLISNTVNSVFIPMKEETFRERVLKWESGVLIQDAFPELPAPIREFIKTGITPSEWDEMFVDSLFE